MKRFSLLVFCMVITSAYVFSQSGFSYQAVIRHADGTLRAGESIHLTVDLLQNGVSVYTETHVIQTNEFGAFSIIIGQGTSEQVYSPAIFLNSDSTDIIQNVLKITESGGNVLSETTILGVPFAEVARVALTAHVEFPPGVIFPFAGPVEKIPPGWMLCDGTVLNKADYPGLYAAIGINWGEPSAETFNLPDLRGVFLRGVSGSAGDPFQDPDAASRISRYPGGAIGNQYGSFQKDEFKSHTHDWAYSSDRDDEGYGSAYNEFTFRPGPISGVILPSGGSETRPANAGVNFIIKY